MMRTYWDERARINAAWYVDTTLNFESPDLERFFASGEETVTTVLGWAPELVSSHGVAVEIGAGLGRISRALAERFERVVGLDISEEMLRKARKLVPNETVSFVVTDGTSLGILRDGSVDLVFSFTVFQHIPDARLIERYIAEIGRVLKPGGMAVLQWNNLPRALGWALRRLASPILNRLRLQRDPYGRYAPAFMGSRVPVRRMIRAVERSGLRVTKTKDTGSLFTWLWAERPI